MSSDTRHQQKLERREEAPAKEAPKPHPELDPAAYLVAAGWKPTAAPGSPECRWMDPTKPAKETSRMVTALVRENKVTRRQETIQQLSVVPEAWPMTLADALFVQRARDRGENRG